MLFHLVAFQTMQKVQAENPLVQEAVKQMVGLAVLGTSVVCFFIFVLYFYNSVRFVGNKREKWRVHAAIKII